MVDGDFDEFRAESDDSVIRALDALSDAVAASIGDEKLLLERLSSLRRARQSGTSVTEAVGHEPNPGALQVLGRILLRMTEASGTARRALAIAMRAEGTTIPAIAQAFGVTHQRVSNVLSRRDTAPG